jgi:hypothetical protein
MSEKTYFFIFYLQTFLSALITVVSFYNFSQRTTLIKLIGVLFAASFICNLAGYLLLVIRAGELVNIPGSLYDCIVVIIGCSIYNHVTKSKYKNVFLSVVVIFLLIALTNLVFLQQLSNASYNKFIGSFILIGFSIYYFFRLMVELPAIHVQRLPMFWINSAFLLYHAGAVVLFAFTDYLINVLKDDLYTYWAFHNILAVVQQVIILIALSYDLKNVGKVAVD